MNFLFKPPDVDILLADSRNRKSIIVRQGGGSSSLDPETHETLPLYLDGENLTGKVNVTLKNNKAFEHNGIKIEFIGTVATHTPDNRIINTEFVCLSKELARPGELSHSKTFPFEFREAEKPFESYYGATIKLRYFIRVTISKLILGNVTKDVGIAVHSLSYYPEKTHFVHSPLIQGHQCQQQYPGLDDPSLRTEVGIEDSLHIEFQIDKPRYHLKDVIVGKVYFVVMRLKLKRMEIELVKKESVVTNVNSSSSTSTAERAECLVKFEIMDGSPSRGETVPIRMMLAGYDLQPTMVNVASRFSVRYYITLVLIDEDDRRYYKTREVPLWRKRPSGDKALTSAVTLDESQQKLPLDKRGGVEVVIDKTTPDNIVTSAVVEEKASDVTDDVIITSSPPEADLRSESDLSNGDPQSPKKTN